jgi:hypothetical protein
VLAVVRMVVMLMVMVMMVTMINNNRAVYLMIQQPRGDIHGQHDYKNNK